MKKEQLFKFSGTVDIEDFRRSKTVNFEGYFVKRGKNEIVGINQEGGKQAFIKGLFINNTQLIFVEMFSQNRYKRGYVFNNIKESGRYSLDDWLSGLFSGESDEMCAKIELKRTWGANQAKSIEKSFQAFYESLDDWDKYFFDETQELKKYLD